MRESQGKRRENQNTISAVCAVAREQGVPINGGDRKNQHNNRNTDTRQGNDPIYLARRILGADPEIFDQLERRNLHPDQASNLRGQRYQAEKLTQGGTGANQHTTEQRLSLIHI